MKKVLLAAAALACIGGTALAGPNAGGSLILALADGVEYTTDNTGYCGATGLQSCGDAIARTDGIAPVVLGVIGAFPGNASPRVVGVTFGWTYDEAEIFIVEAASCGDFELANADWPASGEGTAVTWGVAQTGSLLDIYWVAAYNYYGNPQSLDLGLHPQQGADFADDSIPSVLDPIAAFGSFGFSTDGNVPCPPDVVLTGACCVGADCTVTERVDCNGEYQGDGTVCDPNPCFVEPATGACCAADGSGDCTITTQADCAGTYQGDDTVCDPNPCPIVPTVETTWGSIKGIYR